jgi:four helix bundle protein
MKEQKFRRLEVWKKAMDYVENVYKFTNNFPASELYGLTSQLRRAATSIVLNIAEGCGSGSDNEFNRFLNMSLRSSYEVMCGIEIVKKLGYVTGEAADDLSDKCEEISAMISGLKKKLMTGS